MQGLERTSQVTLLNRTPPVNQAGFFAALMIPVGASRLAALLFDHF
jgi:hypothetical protein